MQGSVVQGGLHYASDVAEKLRPLNAQREDVAFGYTLEPFFHPHMAELIAVLNRHGLNGLLDPTFLARLGGRPFREEYQPIPNNNLVALTFPPKKLDLGDGPYANYNWELLFHIPFTIAVHLSGNQRFAEAQRWFHYIFDPTSNDKTADPPDRYWRFLGFREGGDPHRIEDVLALLSKPEGECTAAELATRARVLAGYETIRRYPFQPHRVARSRPVAYQYAVVMRYLDNLIAWGDTLFMQDTIESINEATQRYVLAANILGPRPQEIPPPGRVRPKTFAELKAAGLDRVGNALVELEGAVPFNLVPTHAEAGGDAQRGPLSGIGRTLYFCVPRNDKLLAYWDTVESRLFKIRHCMNIQGVVRQLSLFDPPIDPGMLVRAAAAGIDVGMIVGGLSQPVGSLRAPFLIQKALELVGEVRGLGAALLGAFEKKDAEHLGLLRQSHEVRMHQLSQEVRFLQWRQAQEATEVLLRTRASALERYHYYQRLLGLKPDSELVPDTLALNRPVLSQENFDETYAELVGQYERPTKPELYPVLELAPDRSVAGGIVGWLGGGGTGRLYLSKGEDTELNELLPAARDFRLVASAADIVASVLTFIPEINVNLHFWGLGGSSKVFGGSKLADLSKIAAQIAHTASAWHADQAGLTAKTASYQRRADEWILQSNLSARELAQIGRQIIASLIAEQAAYREYQNTGVQIEQAQRTDEFLRSKFTSEELYGWMQGEVSRLYYEYYRFAVDVARKAEQTMKRELMRPEADRTEFVRFNYWDGGRRGLLSGEALHLDLKRMELAYHDYNRREYELTKPVSLLQLDPLALLELKATGSCAVAVPEWLFDMECPGHYLRRIKTVAVSIPAITGPFTSVHCTLSLLRSSVRTSSSAAEPYERAPEDPRFRDYVGAVEAIVTSTANNDPGLFEATPRDERFLPFELLGAVGATWRIELPAALRPFDYETIADVILHIRYTAREGGADLRRVAAKRVRELLKEAATSPLLRLFSLRHDFPSAWHAFVQGGRLFSATIRKDYFPYITQDRRIERLELNELRLYAIEDGELVPRPALVLPLPELTERLDRTGELDVSLDRDLIGRGERDVFLLVRYSLRMAQ